MQSKWSEWLAAERAAGRGGRILSELPITRGKAWRFVLALPGDVDGTFDAGIYAEVDAALTSLVTVIASLAEYDVASQTTTLTITIAANATDTELPPDSDLNGLAEVVFKLDWTPPGGTADRALGLVIPIIE